MIATEQHCSRRSLVSIGFNRFPDVKMLSVLNDWIPNAVTCENSYFLYQANLKLNISQYPTIHTNYIHYNPTASLYSKIILFDTALRQK